MASVLTNSSSSITGNTCSGNTRMVGYDNYDPVLCLTISGKQDIRLKLKQSEQIFGPKVEDENDERASIRVVRSLFRSISKLIVVQ
jgi:hypothetical protein